MPRRSVAARRVELPLRAATLLPRRDFLIFAPPPRDAAAMPDALTLPRCRHARRDANYAAPFVFAAMMRRHDAAMPPLLRCAVHAPRRAAAATRFLRRTPQRCRRRCYHCRCCRYRRADADFFRRALMPDRLICRLCATRQPFFCRHADDARPRRSDALPLRRSPPFVDCSPTPRRPCDLLLILLHAVAARAAYGVGSAGNGRCERHDGGRSSQRFTRPPPCAYALYAHDADATPAI